MSSGSLDFLLASKKKLIEALGDNQTFYFQHMKNWFRGRASKEEFDREARKLLNSCTVHLHNEFLLAILTKCQMFTTTAPTTASLSSSLDSGTANKDVFSSTFIEQSNFSNKSALRSNAFGSSMSSNIFSNTFSSRQTSIPEVSSSNDIATLNYLPKSASEPASGSLENEGYTLHLPNNFANSKVVAKVETSGSCRGQNSVNVFPSTASLIHNGSKSLLSSDKILASGGGLRNNSNSLNTCNNLTSLGTSTNAITINNSSSNISIKVEVPFHSLDGNTFMSLGLGAISAPTTPEKKKNSNKQPKKKPKIVKLSSEPVFQSTSLHSLAPSPSLRDPQVLRDSRAGHHTRSVCLLGLGELRGRLLLAAWDHGLNAATEGVVRLLHQAAKQVIQNTLTCVIKSRSGFRVREGRFIHSLGTTPPNPWLRSASKATDWTSDSIGLPVAGSSDAFTAGERPLLWPTVEAAQQQGAHLMAFAHTQPSPLASISCFDLYLALKVNPSVLPCHTVYSLAMERLSCRLSHPDQSALTQERLIRQEQRYRYQLRHGRL